MADPQSPNPSVPGDSVPPPTPPEAAVEEALSQAQSSLQEVQNQLQQAVPLDLPQFTSTALPPDAVNSIDLLSDVELNVTVELGRTQMLVEDVLRLSDGAVVELDKLAGDPVDVYVNGRLIARGEVLVLNDNFCIRISEIVSDLEEQVEKAAQQQLSEQPAT